MNLASRQMFRTTYYSARVRQLSGAVLDLGCGKGDYFAEFGPMARVTAVDKSVRRIQIARKVLELKPIPSIDLIVADAESLPFPSEAFDAIAVSFVFCSVSNMGLVASELARVARPGAALVMMEHVRSTISIVGALQDVLSPAYAAVCNNCHLNRNPSVVLLENGFIIDEARHSQHVTPWLFLAGRRRD